MVVRAPRAAAFPPPSSSHRFRLGARLEPARRRRPRRPPPPPSRRSAFGRPSRLFLGCAAVSHPPPPILPILSPLAFSPLCSSFLRRRPSSDRPSRPSASPDPPAASLRAPLRPFCPRLSSPPPPSPLLPGSSCPFLVISSPSPRLLGNNLPRVLRAIPLCRHSSPARPPACRPPPRRPAPLPPPSLALAVATRCAVIQWASGPDATLFCQPFRTPSSWGSHSIYVCRPDTVLVPVISLQLG